MVKRTGTILFVCVIATNSDTTVTTNPVVLIPAYKKAAATILLETTLFSAITEVGIGVFGGVARFLVLTTPSRYCVCVG